MTGHAPYKGVAHLATVVLVVPLLAYLLGFHRTVRLWYDYREDLNRLTALQKSRPSQAGILPPPGEAEILGDEILLNRLLPTIRRHGGQIERFTPYVTRNDGPLTLCTSEVLLSGGFVPLVRLVAELEENAPYCRIISADYRIITPANPREKKRLQLMLCLQHLSNP